LHACAQRILLNSSIFPTVFLFVRIIVDGVQKPYIVTMMQQLVASDLDIIRMCLRYNRHWCLLFQYDRRASGTIYLEGNSVNQKTDVRSQLFDALRERRISPRVRFAKWSANAISNWISSEATVFGGTAVITDSNDQIPAPWQRRFHWLKAISNFRARRDWNQKFPGNKFHV
jgi:hypothetical protein